MIDNTLGRGQRLLLRVALFYPPFALLLADVLHPRVHEDAATELELSSVHAGRWLAADLLTLTGLALAPAFVFALVYLARGQRSPLALAGAGIALLGITAEAGRTAIDLVVWSLAEHRADPTVPLAVGQLRDQWPFIAAFSVMPFAFIAGLLLLALALARIPEFRRAAWLLAGGLVLIGVSSPLFPVGSNKLLEVIGFALVLSAAGHLFAATAPPAEPEALP